MSEITIQKFITAANGYDTKAVLDLFAAEAVIDDVSVGEKFGGHSGIKKYFETFFIGYHTKTELLSLEFPVPNNILAKVILQGISVMRLVAWISASMKPDSSHTSTPF